MPARGENPNARISADECPVRGYGCRADNFKASRVMVEAPEGALGARRELLPGRRIGEIGKAGRNRFVKIARSIGLDGDDILNRQPRRQWTRQTVGWHRRDADHAAPGPIVRIERARRHTNDHAVELRVQRDEFGRKSQDGVVRGADRLEGVGRDQREEDFADVCFLLGNGLPFLSNVGVVGQIGSVNALREIRHGAPVDMHKELTRGSVGEPKVAKLVGDRAHRFLKTIGRNGHARQRHIDGPIGFAVRSHSKL